MAYLLTARSVFKFALVPIAVFLSAASALAFQGDEEKEAEKTIEEKVEDFDVFDDMFRLYRNPENGDVYMEIAESQLGQEFIAFTYTENGVVDAGQFRGQYGTQQILEPRQYFNKIEFVEKSTSFYFDPDSPLARAQDANISPSLVASIAVEATSEASGDNEKRFLINVSDLYLSEALQQLKPSPNPDRPPTAFSAGDIDSARTRYREVRNYPKNTDVIVDYVFANPYPSNNGRDAVTDARATTVTVQHSFIAMPEPGFQPRISDYRIGYFEDRVTDLTSLEVANYRDLINRWRLVKKDPDAAMSDPVQPIVWWIENTTPLEYRDTIRDAVLAWNQSFEKAGFSNAVQVNVQPDDADWDAGDIRYNVLRWTSSPNPPFGGYGPSFSNPRTGELLGADIMLEYSFIANRANFGDVFSVAGQGLSMGESGYEGAVDGLPGAKSGHACHASQMLQAGSIFARTALQAQGASDEEVDALVKQSIYYLMLHEVGHTLGLNHNMKASVQFGPDEVHDAAITKGAPAGSVMDYPAINVAPIDREQGDFYVQKPGPYDDWAIEFGYRPQLDPIARKALLARSAENGLAFGNDADDMRAPGRGIDPRVNIGDMSSDPVAYAIDRIKLVDATIPRLAERYDDRDSWQDLINAYLIASGQKAGMASVISRQIGGVYVERVAPGQEDAPAPYQPVPREKQIAAMDALAKHFFAADAFDMPEDLLVRLQPQRRGFDFGGETEDPKLHERVLATQMRALVHLLNPVVMERMVNSSLYGGAYSPAEMVLDLNDAIIGNDLKGSPNSFRRNLQIAYVERLAAIVDDPSYSPIARSAVLAGITNIDSRFGLFEFNLGPDTKAHRLQIRRILGGITG